MGHSDEAVRSTDDGTPADGLESALTRYASGDVIAGKYELTRELGTGGMGAVWVARNVTLDVDVAIKLIRMEAPAGGSLLHEARAAARLAHPNVVRILDFGETEQGDPFLVMELLHGDSLSDVLTSEMRISAIRAVRLILPIASALAAAHVKGIVHRDVKPENILLSIDDRGAVVPKLVDFGIAKVRRHDGSRRSTLPGELLGSPEYMSPEQAAGERDIDGRSDVWSLAVVLYESMTGRRPFEEQNYPALLRAIIEQEPTPTTDLAAGDDELWRIVARALVKNREGRWQSALAFGRALAMWALKRGVETDAAGGGLTSQWSSEEELELADTVVAPERAPAEPTEARPALADTTEARPAPEDTTETPSSEPPGRSDQTRPRMGRRLAALSLAILAVAFVARDPILRAGARLGLPIGAVVQPWTTPSSPVGEPVDTEAAAPVETAITPAASAPSDNAAASPAESDRGTGTQACSFSFVPRDSEAPRLKSQLCSETDPRRGAVLLRSAVVAASSRSGPEVVREWSRLGWYEMAAFDVARRGCCPTAPALKLPAPAADCADMAPALGEVATTARAWAAAQRPETDAALQRAIEAFRDAIRCAARTAGGAYGYGGPLRGGEDAAFRKLLLGARTDSPQAASAPSAQAAPRAGPQTIPPAAKKQQPLPRATPYDESSPSLPRTPPPSPYEGSE